MSVLDGTGKSPSGIKGPTSTRKSLDTAANVFDGVGLDGNDKLFAGGER